MDRHLMTAALLWMTAAGTVAAQAPGVPSTDFDGSSPAAPESRFQARIGEETDAVPLPQGVKVVPLQWDDEHGRRDRPGQERFWNWARVKQLAHEVDDRAEHVHREAERQAHHGDRWERQALSDLHRLAERAEHFHRQLERWNQNPSHTRSDYYSVVSAFNQADRSLRYAHSFRHIRQDFETVRRAIGELNYYYRGGYDDGHGGHGGHDDHGNDWSRWPGRWPWETSLGGSRR